MPPRESPRIILDVPLSEIPGSLFDISAVASPCCLRFIDCRAFVNNQRLRLVEVTDLRRTAFSAISYVWKGNPLPGPDGDSAQAETDAGSFAVKGAEDGDMISIDLLRCACIASLLNEGARDQVWSSV